MSPPRPPSSGPTRSALRGLPASVWALGFASMFMDASSELVHSLLPLFMASVLGASMVTIGIVEGVAEATAAVTKVFSGAVSDRLGRRKHLVVVGYALAALTKPIFPLANAIGWVFAARFVDRIGKGIRGAPRDALIADVTPPDQRGAAYGLRQALDSVGACAGPLLAVLFMAWFAGDVRTVMWVAVAPALVTVAIVVFGVREPVRTCADSTAGARRGEAPLGLADAARLSRRFWLVVALGALFTLARFSDAFIVLRAHDVGLALGSVPLVMVAMNVVYAACAWPLGIAADRFRARTLLLPGLAILVVADVVLAAATSPLAVFAGAALWGLHLALTQGLFAKLVADTAPAELRGTAFGLFNLVIGVALLLASIIAGVLWSALGAPAAFITGALFAGASAAGLLVATRHATTARFR